MISSKKFTLDAKNKKVTFCGECTDVCDVCEAICCRTYDVSVTEEERLSARYAVRQICDVTGETCLDPEASCFNRRYYLKRREDGSCVYLGDDNKCSIHEHKPASCRDFKCDNGWKISFAYQSSDPGYSKRRKKIVKKFMDEMLKDDMVFAMDTAGGAKAVFYSAGDKELIAVKKPPGRCAPFRVKSPLESFSGGDGDIALITDLLDGEHTLGEVCRRVDKSSGGRISREEVYSVIWALYGSGMLNFKSGTNIFKTKTTG